MQRKRFQLDRLLGRPTRSRADDLGHDALEVVRRSELHHDLAAPLAHLDRDAGRELFGEQLLHLGKWVLVWFGHRGELSGALDVRGMIEVVEHELLDLANGHVFGRDANRQRPLGFRVPQREQRATVARLDPALSEQLLHLGRELQ